MTVTASTPIQKPERRRGNTVLDWLKGQYALYILIVLLIIASVSSSAFLTSTNLTNLLLQMSIIGVVVMAELIVVLTPAASTSASAPRSVWPRCSVPDSWADHRSGSVCSSHWWWAGSSVR